MKTLTPEQLAAIQQYAADHGRTWKSKLNHEWMTGNTTGELQQLRNAYGPSWLASFKLSPRQTADQIAANARKPYADQIMSMQAEIHALRALAKVCGASQAALDAAAGKTPRRFIIGNQAYVNGTNSNPVTVNGEIAAQLELKARGCNHADTCNAIESAIYGNIGTAYVGSDIVEIITI